jgi:positive regulator of sigma E activity
VAAGRVDVDFEPPPRCKGCDGACVWYRMPRAQRITFATPLDVDVAIGATVAVTLPERQLLLGTFVVYGAPLVALLGGAALGAAAFGSDLGAAAGAVAGLIGAGAAAPLWRSRFERAILRQIKILPLS